MSNFFDSLPQSFVDVAITEDGIDTVGFLAASNGTVRLFDLIGTRSISYITQDIVGNILRVRNYHRAHPEQADTLEHLILSEKGNCRKGSATEALLWLMRAHRFTRVGMQRFLDYPEEEISVGLGISYKETLVMHHNFLLRQATPRIFKAIPSRKVFEMKLGGPSPEFDVSLQKWLDALDGIVRRIIPFIENGEYSEGLAISNGPVPEDSDGE